MLQVKAGEQRLRLRRLFRLGVGVELDHVVVASTHQHEGKDTMGLWGQDPAQTGYDPAYIQHIIDETVAAAEAYDDLEGIEAFERDYLLQALQGDRFDSADSGFLRNNPVSYMGKLGFGVYVDREYAPPGERLAAYTTYIAEVPRMLAQMRDAGRLLAAEGLSLLVHADGTRSLSCRQPVQQISSVLLDLAVDKRVVDKIQHPPLN